MQPTPSLDDSTVELVTAIQGLAIELARQPLQITFSTGSSLPVDVAAPTQPEVEHKQPPALLEVAQLLNLFEIHRGFVPAFELIAEGFSIPGLLSRRLIAPPMGHLDGGCYLVGEALRKAVARV